MRLIMTSTLFCTIYRLIKFWSGVELNVKFLRRKTICCALLCVTCDLAAGRKACGFLGHNAHLGCSRCFKKFEGSVGEGMNFSGFVRENWPPRTGTRHRRDAYSLAALCTKTDLQKTE